MKAFILNGILVANCIRFSSGFHFFLPQITQALTTRRRQLLPLTATDKTRGSVQDIVNTERYSLESESLVQQLRDELHERSVICLKKFVQPSAVQKMVEEALSIERMAYYTKDKHNIYLAPMDSDLPPDHISNHQVITSKGCVTTDQIPPNSMLKKLYFDHSFQKFLSKILDVDNLYPYADPLSSLTIHYGGNSQELGWHFDNSAFAITLLLQEPSEGGIFEYIPNIREPVSEGEETITGFRNEVRQCREDEVKSILCGELPAGTLDLGPGTLTLFCGRDSLHRVTKVVGDRKRVLVVLAYNEIPGQRLPDETMMTFFGRTA